MAISAEKILYECIGMSVKPTAESAKRRVVIDNDGLALVFDGNIYKGYPYVRVTDRVMDYYQGAVEIFKLGIKQVAVIRDDEIEGLIDYVDFVKLINGELSVSDLESLMVNGSA